MRILDFYDVTFKGKPTGQSVGFQTFTIQQDDGECFEVTVPDVDNTITAFRWMSDNDCLRHLKSVEPTFTDNSQEIQEILEKNTQIEEHAYLTGSVSVHYSSSAGIQNYIANLLPVPAYEYTCTWSFTSKEHAVMFKLACGGTP